MAVEPDLEPLLRFLKNLGMKDVGAPSGVPGTLGLSTEFLLHLDKKLVGVRIIVFLVCTSGF